MDEYDASTYGERIADVYDELHGGRSDTPAAVALLEELAHGGPALELAIGTGRVALPLTARGVRVDDVDASPAMAAKLHEKSGADEVSVTFGDFADVRVPGRYPLIFVIFNSFFALLTQDEQVRCFANVAERARPHGATRRASAARPLGRLAPRTVRLVQRSARERLRALSPAGQPYQCRGG